jgi:AcrR family transcriptional regulator
VADRSTHVPHQARSRRTERLIADALRALLRQKPFPDISVAEIASAAGVSIGGFYARYASKEALLAMVELSMLEDFAASAREALDNVGESTADIAHAYASLLVTNFQTHRDEILQILRYAQNNSASQDQLRQFNHSVHDRIRQLLRGRASETTVNLALFFASAAAREAILTRNIRMYPVELSDAELSAEIALAFTAYIERAVSVAQQPHVS